MRSRRRRDAAGTTVPVHVKVDTGMTRLGLDLSGVGAFGTALREMPRLVVEGVFSHLASADDVDSAAVRTQLARFRAALELLGELGFRPPHVHLANRRRCCRGPTRTSRWCVRG